MSQWITDRLPTKGDAPLGHVCIALHDNITVLQTYDTVTIGTPWKPIALLPPNTAPDEYVDDREYLRKEVDRLTQLCIKYRHFLDADVGRDSGVNLHL